jgi:hypothetical protein
MDHVLEEAEFHQILNYFIKKNKVNVLKKVMKKQFDKMKNILKLMIMKYFKLLFIIHKTRNFNK